MAEVGHAQRTIFLARYLRGRELQREINEGLNVVESWNRANAVIFFGKGGDIATNRRDEQELSVLCLRILQAALAERPDYAYLKEVFRHLRAELDIEVTRAPKKLPYMPTEAEIRAFYDAGWKARRASDVILINTLLYTGVRVSKLVRIRIADVDLDACRIRITQGKGGKDRVVPFPPAFKETLALHIDAQRRPARCSCSSRAEEALQRLRRPQDPGPLHPGRRHHRLDQPPHAAPLPVYLAQDPGHRRRAHPALQRPRHPPVPGDLARLALADAQQRYDDAIGDFRV
jgi:integrase